MEEVSAQTPATDTRFRVVARDGRSDGHPQGSAVAATDEMTDDRGPVALSRTRSIGVECFRRAPP